MKFEVARILFVCLAGVATLVAVSIVSPPVPGKPMIWHLVFVTGMLLAAAYFSNLIFREPIAMNQVTPAEVSRRLVEVRKRGFFGYVFAFVFWAWNALMVLWLGTWLLDIGEKQQAAMSAAERTGFEAGVGLGFISILITWAAGAVVFGLLMYATRGRRELIEMRG